LRSNVARWAADEKRGAVNRVAIALALERACVRDRGRCTQEAEVQDVDQYVDFGGEVHVKRDRAPL
jgi:hypothetical protein